MRARFYVDPSTNYGAIGCRSTRHDRACGAIGVRVCGLDYLNTVESCKSYRCVLLLLCYITQYRASISQACLYTFPSRYQHMLRERAGRAVRVVDALNRYKNDKFP